MSALILPQHASDRQMIEREPGRREERRRGGGCGGGGGGGSPPVLKAEQEPVRKRKAEGWVKLVFH